MRSLGSRWNRRGAAVAARAARSAASPRLSTGSFTASADGQRPGGRQVGQQRGGAGLLGALRGGARGRGDRPPRPSRAATPAPAASSSNWLSSSAICHAVAGRPAGVAEVGALERGCAPGAGRRRGSEQRGLERAAALRAPRQRPAPARPQCRAAPRRRSASDARRRSFDDHHASRARGRPGRVLSALAPATSTTVTSSLRPLTTHSRASALSSATFQARLPTSTRFGHLARWPRRRRPRGWPAQADEGALAVARHRDAHRRDVVGARALDLELRACAITLWSRGRDDADAGAELVGDPQLAAVGRERQAARALADLDVLHHLGAWPRRSRAPCSRPRRSRTPSCRRARPSRPRAPCRP